LWVSDAVAWCFQKGGAWRTAISRIVADVRHPPPTTSASPARHTVRKTARPTSQGYCPLHHLG
jgi:hypothetical protein